MDVLIHQSFDLFAGRQFAAKVPKRFSIKALSYGHPRLEMEAERGILELSRGIFGSVLAAVIVVAEASISDLFSM